MRIVPKNSFVRLFAASAALAALAVAGCTHSSKDDSPETAAYAVNIVKGAATELDHPNYDPTLPGYWLVGDTATIQMSRLAGVDRPKTFSFMLRTKADASASKPSEVDLLKILSPRYRIVTKYNPAKTAPVDVLAYREEKAGTEVVLVKTDDTGKYIAFERVGERIKVTLTEEGMKLIGDAATLSWSDLPPGVKSEADREVLQNEGYRRVIQIK